MSRLWITSDPSNSASSMIAWPSWFRSFVTLGSVLRIPSTLPLLATGARYTLIVSLPTSRLAAAGIAIGLVASSHLTDPRYAAPLDADGIRSLPIGSRVRVVEHAVGGEGATVLLGAVSVVGFTSIGHPTVTIDTVVRGGHSGSRTYRIGTGTTRFESVSTELDRARVEVGDPTASMREWIGGSNYLDYVLSSAAELLWVGERTRIEGQDMQFSIARSDVPDPLLSVEIGQLLRPRSVGSRSALGWHTELSSSLAQSLPVARFSPWRTAIFDGNTAISRHLALSESGVNICLIDASNRTKQSEAIALVSDKVRWGTKQSLGVLLPWTPPSGTQAILISEDA